MKDTILPTVIEAWKKYNFNVTLTDTEVVDYFDDFVLFVIQSIKLQMFIPINDKGEPLEEPENYDKYNPNEYKSGIIFSKWFESCKEYQKAKDRVIFKGFKVVEKIGSVIIVVSNGNKRVGFEKVKTEWFNSKSIQDLCGKDVQLVDKEYKRLNLR